MTSSNIFITLHHLSFSFTVHYMFILCIMLLVDSVTVRIVRGLACQGFTLKLHSGHLQNKYPPVERYTGVFFLKIACCDTLLAWHQIWQSATTHSGEWPQKVVIWRVSYSGHQIAPPSASLLKNTNNAVTNQLVCCPDGSGFKSFTKSATSTSCVLSSGIVIHDSQQTSVPGVLYQTAHGTRNTTC